MKKLLTLALCMFCGMFALNAAEAAKTVAAEEIDVEETEEVASSDEVAAADAQKVKKAQEEKSSCGSCRK